MNKQKKKNKGGRPRIKWKHHRKNAKPIRVYDKEKLSQINIKTLRLYRQYISYCEDELERKPQTMYQYKSDLNIFFLYLLDYKDNMCVADVTDDDFYDFIAYRKRMGNRDVRLGRLWSVASSLFSYLVSRKYMDHNPAGCIMNPARTPFVLKDDDE